MESIRSAAAKYSNGTIRIGKDHEAAYDSVLDSLFGTPIMGFMTTKYNFVSRVEAEGIAFNAGQIKNEGNGMAGLSSEELLDNHKYTNQLGYQRKERKSHGSKTSNIKS